MNSLLSVMRKLYGYFLYYNYRHKMKDLINRGLTLGKNVTIENTVVIDKNYPYLIRIGDNSSLGQGTILLAHDATPYKFLDGHTRLGKIDIRENVFIGINVIILPGVTIGPNVLVAAGSVVNKDIPPNSCVAGVPARFYRKFDEFLAEMKDQIATRTTYRFADLRSHQIDVDEVRASVADGIAFIRGFEGTYRYTLNP